MSEPINARDLFIKLTDPTGKHPTTTSQHRVWDGAAFISSQRHLHDGPDIDPEDRRLVSLATADEYRTENSRYR